MVTVPEANRILWEALDALYVAQRDAALRTRQAIAKLSAAHPEIAHDPLAREALRAAVSRQDGMNRYAESQVGLAETMRAYWEQRSSPLTRQAEPMPLVRRSAPPLAAPSAPRAVTTVNVAE